LPRASTSLNLPASKNLNSRIKSGHDEGRNN
jgi:hypothetical protein